MQIQILSKNKIHNVLFDAEDQDLINQYHWNIIKGNDTFYAFGYKNGRGNERERIRMHRLIMNAPDDVLIDHENRNGLDNHRKNLREITKAGNGRNCKLYKNNKSSFIGVYNLPNGRFRASITIKGKGKYLGTFNTAKKAHDAYMIEYNKLIKTEVVNKAVKEESII